MGSFFIGLFSVLLLITSLIIVLLVLVQRTSSGMGAGIAGGGAAESALGAQAGQVLTRWTIYGSVAFFVLCFGLYLGYMGGISSEHDIAGAPVLPKAEALGSGALTEELPADN